MAHEPGTQEPETQEPETHEPGLAGPGGSRPPRRRRRSRALIHVVAVAIAVLAYAAIQILGWEGFRVVSDSMEETLLAGDRVLANKLLYGARLPGVAIRLPALRSPVVGDVVIFRHPEQPDVNVIKRCVAVGGQMVELRDGHTLIDGEPDRWEQPTPGPLPEGVTPVRREAVTLRVPDGMLFVLGDNRDRSSDSRDWGFVPLDDVIGKAELIVWSRGRDPGSDVRIRWDRIGDRVR